MRGLRGWRLDSMVFRSEYVAQIRDKKLATKEPGSERVLTGVDSVRGNH